MRPARPGGPGANLTLLTLYREPPDFEGEPNYSGDLELDPRCREGAIRATLRDQPRIGGATLGEPAILISDRKISALVDRLPIFEKPPQQVT